MSISALYHVCVRHCWCVIFSLVFVYCCMCCKGLSVLELVYCFECGLALSYDHKGALKLASHHECIVVRSRVLMLHKFSSSH